MKRRVCLGLLSLVLVSMLVGGCTLFGSKSGQVHGVVEFSDGTPAAGYTVSLAGKTATVQDDGRFTFSGIPYNTYVLKVLLDEEVVHEQQVNVSAPSQSVAVVLPGSVVSGSVRFADDQPVAGAVITIGNRKATTNEEGEFAVGGISFGEYTLQIAYGGYRYSEDLKVEDTVVEGLEFVLPTPVNVALNKTATASSVHGSYTPNKVVDGVTDNVSSRWINLRDAQPPHWVEVDLGETYTLAFAHVWTGNIPYQDTYVVSKFALQYWQDDEWIDIPGGTVEGNDQMLVVLLFDEAITTSRVRFISDAGDPAYGQVRVIELELFAMED